MVTEAPGLSEIELHALHMCGSSLFALPWGIIETLSSNLEEHSIRHTSWDRSDGMVKRRTKYCKFLNREEVCQYGCGKINGKQKIMCHKCARGECKYGEECHHGLHRQPRTPNSVTTQPRGDGFRRHTTDTAVEITLKKHLAALMLSSRCKDLLELDSDTLEKLYKMLALKRHPDKMIALDSEPANPANVSGDRFVQLLKAKEYVEKMLPFRLAT